MRRLRQLVLGLSAITVVTLAVRGPMPTPTAQASVRVRVEPNTEQPRVAPGLVRWHATLADAQRAASASGKPVLLFEMFGRLDHRFC
jgi:hypothetical protein